MLCLLATLPLAACANIPARDQSVEPAREEWTALAPGLRIDRDRRLLEFEGTVPIDCHDPITPDVYLELIACSPDTREHESLVVTEVPPSLIHAGLLALGYEPGRPGSVRVTRGGVERIRASGDPLAVTLLIETADGWQGAPASAWVTDAATRSRTLEPGWVFAGSRIAEFGGEQVYDADGRGTVIGLTTFGSETIGYREILSPESSIDEPAWIADPDAVPARGTPVRVRLGPGQP